MPRCALARSRSEPWLVLQQDRGPENTVTRGRLEPLLLHSDRKIKSLTGTSLKESPVSFITSLILYFP